MHFCVSNKLRFTFYMLHQPPSGGTDLKPYVPYPEPISGSVHPDPTLLRLDSKCLLFGLLTHLTLPYMGFDFECFLSARLLCLLQGNDVCGSELVWRRFFPLNIVYPLFILMLLILFWLVFSQYALLRSCYFQAFCICVAEVWVDLTKDEEGAEKERNYLHSSH